MGKDIDFDELDKAVNSLMGNVAPDVSDEDPKAKTLRINSTLQPGERPAYSRLDEVAKSIGSETLVLDGERTILEDLDALQLNPTAPMNGSVQPGAIASPEETPLPVRASPEIQKEPMMPRPTSGRFMDVVHPSSDMRTAASDPLPLVVPERDTAPVTDASVPVVSDFQFEQPPQPEAIVSVPEPEPVPASAAQSPIAPPAIEIPLTPFLPDAKVEKRPLGGAPMPLSDSKPESEVGMIEDENGDELPYEPPEPPVEMMSDSFTGTTASVPESIADDSQKEADPQTVTRIPPEAAESVRAVESADTEKLSAVAQAGGYANARLGDADQGEGAIYDVDNQPQPLGHPTRQKSGWGTVLIILIVIVLSAALGAAAYFILGLGA